MLSGKDKDSYIYMDLHIYKVEKWEERNLTKFNKGKKINPASGEEEPHAPIYAGDWQAIRQLCRKIPGVPGGHQGEHEPAAFPCSTKGLRWLRQLQGDDPASLLSTGERTVGRLCMSQEGQEHNEGYPVSKETDGGTGAYLL